MSNARNPDRTTMEGMISTANRVLETALDPKTPVIPRKLFDKAIGLIIMSVFEVGFIFSGNVGTGIILQKNRDGSWSNPSACGLSGVGWGLLAGGSVKEVIVFIMDDFTLQTASGESGVKLGVQAELSLGPYGRAANIDLNLSSRGAGSTVSVAFSKGLFGALSIEGGVVGARHATNDTFYGKDVSPHQILNNEVPFPSYKATVMNEVYDKLEMLAH
jgi:lipid-binding SYLF domain-containing protein